LIPRSYHFVQLIMKLNMNVNKSDSLNLNVSIGMRSVMTNLKVKYLI
jgi:hypothetical protein